MSNPNDGYLDEKARQAGGCLSMLVVLVVLLAIVGTIGHALGLM